MDAEFWVAVGFVSFILLAVYIGGHKRIGEMLDARGEKVRDDLAAAERMRREAADILASFESKRAEAERQAAKLVEDARAEAEQIAKDAEAKLADFVRRRTAQVDAKIANAEVQALAQVRAAAAEAATAAAEIVLHGGMKSGLADKLVEQSISDVKRLAQ